MSSALIVILPYYGVAGLAYATWLIPHQFRGGEKSLFIQRLTTMGYRYMLEDRVWYALGFVALLLWGAFWPAGVIIWIVSAVKAWPASVQLRQVRRTFAVVFQDSTLMSLRNALSGHEDDYEQVFTERELPLLTRALHGIDLDKFGANNNVTYPTIVTAAIVYLDYQHLSSQGQSEQAETVRIGIIERNEGYLMQIGFAFAALMAGYCTGWLPGSGYDGAHKWYAQYLRADMVSTELMAEIFTPIECRTSMG